MRAGTWPGRLDDRAVPRLAAWTGRSVAACRRAAEAGPVRVLYAALRDTGLVGPGIVLVLLAGCLLAATGAS